MRFAQGVDGPADVSIGPPAREQRARLRTSWQYP